MHRQCLWVFHSSSGELDRLDSIAALRDSCDSCRLYERMKAADRHKRNKHGHIVAGAFTLGPWSAATCGGVSHDALSDPHHACCCCCTTGSCAAFRRRRGGLPGARCCPFTACRSWHITHARPSRWWVESQGRVPTCRHFLAIWLQAVQRPHVVAPLHRPPMKLPLLIWPVYVAIATDLACIRSWDVLACIAMSHRDVCGGLDVPRKAVIAGPAHMLQGSSSAHAELAVWRELHEGIGYPKRAGLGSTSPVAPGGGRASLYTVVASGHRGRACGV